MRTILVPSLLAMAAIAPALDSHTPGPRALGMGGTGTAIVDDQNAQFWNPAAFGFFDGAEGETKLPSDNNALGRKDWGFGLDLNVGYHVQGDLANLIEKASKIDWDELGQNGSRQLTEQDITDLATIANVVSSVGDPGNVVTATLTTGLGVRVGRFGLGVRVFGESGAIVSDTDLVNVALDVSGAALADEINASGSNSDGTVQLFNADQQARLISALGGGGDAVQALAILDFQAREVGVTADQVDVAFAALENAASGSGQNLSENTTTVTLRGFGLLEVPLTYGHSFGEHFSIGGNLKFMAGRVYANTVPVFEESVDQSLQDSLDTYEQTYNFGVDLAVMARMRMLQVGLTGRNLNSPSFTGPTSTAGTKFSDVTVDPSLTLGAAFVPWETLAIAMDIDLLEYQDIMEVSDTRRLGAGIEWNPYHVLALRLGAWKNLANSEHAPVFTAGVGLNLWAVRFDLAAATTTEMVDIDGTEVPEQAQVSMGLMVDF